MKKTEGVQKLWNKYKYAALVVLIGVGLLLWPGKITGKTLTEEPVVTTASEETDICREMEEILAAISGVGQVRVMLTTDSDGERQLAQDTELTYSGNTAAPEDYTRRSEIILIEESEGNTGAVVTRRIYPTYRGALVVCQGGDRADVKLTVTEAVASLTGLSADRITVAKWQ